MTFRVIELMIFFNDTATTEIYTLSLHDALPISEERFTTMADLAPALIWVADAEGRRLFLNAAWTDFTGRPRSEEHTSELQSRQYFVCRLLLEKKMNILYGLYQPEKGDIYITGNK